MPLPAVTLPPALRDFWQKREPKEQQALMAAAVVLAVLLCWFLLLGPLLQERARLRSALPGLRVEAAQFQRDLALVKGGASATTALVPSSGLSERVPALAAGVGIADGALQISPLPNNRLQLLANGISWEVWVSLLTRLRNERIHIDRMMVKAGAEGRIQAEAELSR